MRWHRTASRSALAQVWLASSAAALVAVVGLSSCGANEATPGGHAGSDRHAIGSTAARPLQVAASDFPLAQLASYIGGPDAHVVDLAPPGVRPEDLAVGPLQRQELRSAALVIDVGDGYQPAVEAEAKTAKRNLSVLPAVSGQALPYEFWLDPYLMSTAAVVIANSMSAADPAARQQFEAGSRDFQSVASSIESDFESTLTQCQNSYLVTADDAFGRMAASFDLTDVAVSTVGVASAVSAVSARQLPAVFGEVGVPSGLVQEVALRAGVGIKTLNPMETAPQGAGQAPSYFATMEENLSAMEGPLACDTSDNFS